MTNRTNHVRGEAHGRAKMDEDKVRGAMALKLAGASTRALAILHKISRRQMQRILNGYQWKHVK